MQIIIITAADANYFELVRSTILSVREKPEGKNVAIGFFDLGCTPEQLQWLKTQVNSIQQPDWHFEFPGKNAAPHYLKGLLARPFLRNYFPNFDIYLWIDADAWVQDWHAVELLVKGAAKRGLAVVPELDRCYGLAYGKLPWYWQFVYRDYQESFGEEVAQQLHSYPTINAGIFALHKDAQHWEIWAEYLEEGLQHQVSLMTDQIALNRLVYGTEMFDRTEMLPARCNWSCNFGLPVWDKQQACFVEPYLPHEAIGILHLTGHKHDAVKLATTDGDTIEISLRYQPMQSQTMTVPGQLKMPNNRVLPAGDYVSPGLQIILPDAHFPHMVVGDTNTCPWPYLRREIPHNWYVDRRANTVGFLSRDEAHILYNTALKFAGKKALEIGCWLGWSACHLAIAGVQLDVVDPLLEREDIRQSVIDSIQGALNASGVQTTVELIPGYSPQRVEEFAAQFNRKWSLIFIDGEHEGDGPLNDAIACEKLAEKDAIILFHDLAAPAVAKGLDYLKQRGWQTVIYQTMQIMGAAWRGNVEPVKHQPDPNISWNLPAHLQGYAVSGISNNISNNISKNISNDRPLDGEITVRQVHEKMQQAVELLHSNQPLAALQLTEQIASLNIHLPGMYYLRSICLSNLGRHQEALAAAKVELAIDPTHRQAQAKVEKLTNALLRSQRKIPTQQRSWNTSLSREHMLLIQNASLNYSYRGVPMLKNPFDFALYPLLFWNLKPRTIIEIGSKSGGSALWFGDMLNNFGIDGHIYSIDIFKVTSVQHPRVTYMKGNGQALQEVLTPDFLNSLPRPLLVIEDADHSYETSKYVLEFFHPYLKQEEYIVIEDGIISDLEQDASYNSGPHKALKEFLSQHKGEYEIDSNFCDRFGYNMTWCTNGFLKKIKAPTPPPSSSKSLSDKSSDREFQEIVLAVTPYSLLSEARLFSLYSLAKQICVADLPGNFVECGTCKGGSAALLASVIKKYSRRPRVLYAFDTFEGMPAPTEVDRHQGIPANLTNFGEGTLKASISEHLDKICELLQVRDIVVPVKGLFAQTLPQYKSAIGSIALLHADGDWYESTMDIFNTLYDSVIASGLIQIDDYGHWEGCKQAIHDFERMKGESFNLHAIDDTGVWLQKLK
ncbi:MAG: class I SAM-dependent methyltransferase [Oscillatoriaceae cyanobacterium Prado104]|jgi:cephalosporin hydroxylase|nr:class I SAM-dependent methyltransferase [Oscillatoriaceae cyanobacterium Prado104]